MISAEHIQVLLGVRKQRAEAEDAHRSGAAGLLAPGGRVDVMAAEVKGQT